MTHQSYLQEKPENTFLESYTNFITTTTEMTKGLINRSDSQGYDIPATKKILSRFIAVGIHDLITLYDGVLGLDLYSVQTDEMDLHIDVAGLTAVGIRLMEIVQDCTDMYNEYKNLEDLTKLAQFISSDSEGSLQSLMQLLGEENRYQIEADKLVYFNHNLLSKFGIQFRGTKES